MPADAVWRLSCHSYAAAVVLTPSIYWTRGERRFIQVQVVQPALFPPTPPTPLEGGQTLITGNGMGCFARDTHLIPGAWSKAGQLGSQRGNSRFSCGWICEDLMKAMDPLFQNIHNMRVISATSQTFSLGTLVLDHSEFLSALRTNVRY